MSQFTIHSAAYLATCCRQPVATIRKRIAEGGLEPVGQINGIEYFSADATQAILDHFAGQHDEHAARAEALQLPPIRS